MVWHQSKTSWTLKLAADFQNTKPEIQIMNNYEYIVSYSDEYIGCVEESHKCFEDAKRELDALSEMKEEGLTILRAKVGGDYTHALNGNQWIKFC